MELWVAFSLNIHLHLLLYLKNLILFNLWFPYSAAYLFGCTMCRGLSFERTTSLSRFARIAIATQPFLSTKYNNHLFGFSVLHEEVHDIHCGKDEGRETFCISGRPYHLGTGMTHVHFLSMLLTVYCPIVLAILHGKCSHFR